MATSLENFKLGLYREHLEEASALYDLRKALLGEPDREWTSLGDFEARIEAHVDALVIGGPLALQVCGEQIRDGDAGELFAGVCVCCRQRSASLFASMWRELTFDDQSRVQAVTDALKFELPDVWTAAAQQAIASGDENRLSILAVAAAYRRLSVGSSVVARLDALPSLHAPGLAWALARLKGANPVPALEKCLKSPSPEVRSNALVGLLRAGEWQVLRTCYLTAQTEDWPHLAMGLAGDRQAATILRQRLEANRASRHTVVALGLLGDPTTVRSLIAALESEELAEAAALALHWITGAPLYEDVFVAEPVDELELFEGEKIAWRESGAVPRRADGKPYGTEVRPLSQDKEVWGNWLNTRAREFEQSVRYRRGKPYGLRGVFDCLSEQLAPRELRQFAYEELALRYGCPEWFEADARVVDQLKSLRRIAKWAQDNERGFVGSVGTFFFGRA